MRRPPNSTRPSVYAPLFLLGVAILILGLLSQFASDEPNQAESALIGLADFTWKASLGAILGTRL